MAAPVTAALLVIGDEILTGRTKDKNIGYIAEYLTGIGIDLSRGPGRARRGGGDRRGGECAARAATPTCSPQAASGPTHDDITADAIAKAFGVTIDIDPRAVAMLQERYQPGELNEARLRMARIPAGADLIENPISKAPGFRLGNVFVMAGVPAIMQAMLDVIAPSLETGLADDCRDPSRPKGYRKASMRRGLGEIASAHPARVHRLLSVVFHGGLPQPDRRARQGCRGGCERGRRRPRSAPPPQGRRRPTLI